MHQPTLDHYTHNSTSFQKWAHSQTPNIDYARSLFLVTCEKNRNLHILDVGCGPGRDAHYFHLDETIDEIVAIDPVPAFCEQTKELIGEENVVCMDILQYNRPPDSLDGVYAMASLFHVDRIKLPATLGKLYFMLKDEGLFLSTFPATGKDLNKEGIDGRWNNEMPLELQKKFLKKAGFHIEYIFKVDVYDAEWDAILARKTSRKNIIDYDESDPKT